MTAQERNEIILKFLGWKYNKEVDKYIKGNMTFPLSYFNYKEWNKLIPVYNLIWKKSILDYSPHSLQITIEQEFEHMSEDFIIGIMENDIKLSYKVLADFLAEYYKALKIHEHD